MGHGNRNGRFSLGLRSGSDRAKLVREPKDLGCASLAQSMWRTWEAREGLPREE